MHFGSGPTIRVNEAKQQRQIQTRVVSKVTFITVRRTCLRLMTGMVAPYLFLFTIYEGGAPSKVFTKFYIKLVTNRYI
jgi:hypothetical protein